MTLVWNGRNDRGKPQRSGRYTARITFIDANARARQTETLVFSHESDEARRKKYAEVQGQVRLQDQGGKRSANTVIELVDEKGEVVQRTRTTAQGNYRFKNVDEGRYRVRVKKRGWKDKEAKIRAQRSSAPANIDLDL